MSQRHIVLYINTTESWWFYWQKKIAHGQMEFYQTDVQQVQNVWHNNQTTRDANSLSQKKIVFISHTKLRKQDWWLMNTVFTTLHMMVLCEGTQGSLWFLSTTLFHQISPPCSRINYFLKQLFTTKKTYLQKLLDEGTWCASQTYLTFKYIIYSTNIQKRVAY